MSRKITMANEDFAGFLAEVYENYSVGTTDKDVLAAFARALGMGRQGWEHVRKILPYSSADMEDYLIPTIEIDANSVESMARIMSRIGPNLSREDVLNISKNYLDKGAISSEEIGIAIVKLNRDGPKGQTLYTASEKVIQEIAEQFSKRFIEDTYVSYPEALSMVGRTLHGRKGERSFFSEGRFICLAEPGDLSRRMDFDYDTLLDLTRKLFDVGMTHPAMSTQEVKAFIFRNVPGVNIHPLQIRRGTSEHFERTNTLNKGETLGDEPISQAPEAGGLDIDAKALSRIVDRVAEEVRRNPKATKSVLLNIVAAQIAGPGHDWGLVKNGGRGKRVENGSTIPAVPVGPTLVGTHFSICDLPMAAFDNDPEKAADFLYMNRSKIEDAMSTAGNEAIRSCMIWDGLEWDPDDEDDTFSHEAWQEREVNVVRLGQTPSYMSLGPVVIAKEGDLQQVSWTEDRSQATRFSYRKASNMGLPENCALLPIAIAEPEIEAEPDFRP